MAMGLGSLLVEKVTAAVRTSGSGYTYRYNMEYTKAPAITKSLLTHLELVKLVLQLVSLILQVLHLHITHLDTSVVRDQE